MKNRPFLEKVLDDWPAKILSLAAAVMLFFFTGLTQIETRIMSLPIHYVISPGLTEASQYPAKATVSIRGEHGAIYAIAESDLEILADFSAHEEEGQYSANLERKFTAPSANGGSLEISMQPQSVALSLERQIVKEIPIRVHIETLPSAGYRLGDYSVFPSVVKVAGPRSRMQDIDSISTEAVDLSGQSSTLKSRVKLISSDPLLKILGGDTVEFNAQIDEEFADHQVDGVPIVLLGLQGKLELKSSLPAASFVLEGKKSAIDAYTADGFRLVVDASSVTSAGTWTLKAIPDVPPSLRVKSFNPESLNLEFEAKPANGNSP